MGICWRNPHLKQLSKRHLFFVVAVLFVVPHDRSTRLRPDRVGGDAFLIGAPSLRLQQPSRASADRPASMGIVSAPLDFGGSGSLILRLCRCAVSRPESTARMLCSKLIANRKATASDWEPSADSAWNASELVPTTVEELRRVYGTSRYPWGDLGANEARSLYHQLLPTTLLEDDLGLPLHERAQLAVAARKAAKLYVRERTLAPLAIGSELYDGMRQLYQRGSFQPQGLSEEQVWLKYAGVSHPSLLLDSADASCGADVDALEDIFFTVLKKSCSSNPHVDFLSGCAALGP